MKKSIFQELNLKTPEEVFNFLGNQQFGREWTERPLQILQGIRKKPKPVSKVFLRNKYMADKVCKKFVEFLNDKNVTIYVQKKKDVELEVWEGVRCSLERKNFLLIDQEIHLERGPMDIDYMPFWIEMPKDKNPLSFRKAGRPPELDLEYLKSVLNDVAKLVPEKITFAALADKYKEFLKNEEKASPSASWLCDNLNAEIKKLKETQGH